MKKKLLAIIAVVAMVATLLVPMFAVSAEEGKIVFDFGKASITNISGTNYLLLPINIVENTDEVFTAQVGVISDQGLTAFEYWEQGDISDVYTDPFGNPKSFGFGEIDTFNTNYEGTGMVAFVLESSRSQALTTTGWVITLWYVLPAGVTSVDEYTFTLDTDYTFVARFDTSRVPVYQKCNHSSVKEVVVNEAECEVAGEKKTVCNSCGQDVETGIVISAIGHDWVEDTDAYVAPGCETEGKKVEVCSRADKCGVAAKETPVAATGHDMQEAPGTEATCTQGGTIVKECANGCGERETTVGEALGHNWVEDPDAYVAPGCETEGKKVEVCSRADQCGVAAKETPVAATGHNWVEDTDAYVAPGCETEGKKVEVCSKECGVAAKETPVAATGHGETKEEIVKKAECEVAGEKKTVCKVCGQDVQTGIVIPATGHAYESDQLQSTAPDCVTDGKVVDVCKNGCGKIEETVIPKLGHDFNGEITIVEEATVEAEGKLTVGCTRCDEAEEREIPKLVTEVGGEDDEFSIKVEGDVAIPADTELVGAEVDEKLEGVDGLGIVGGFTFATETSKMDLAEVKGEVSIDLGDIAKKYNKVTIGVINAEGKVEKVEATITDGKAVFNGALGATYVVMGEEIVVEDEKPSSDKTADVFSVVLYVAAALVAAAGVVVISKKRFAL